MLQSTLPPVLRWVRIVARCNRVLAADLPIAPQHRHFATALVFQILPCSIHRLPLRWVDAGRLARIVALIRPCPVWSGRNRAVLGLAQLGASLSLGAVLYVSVACRAFRAFRVLGTLTMYSDKPNALSLPYKCPLAITSSPVSAGKSRIRWRRPIRHRGSRAAPAVNG